MMKAVVFDPQSVAPQIVHDLLKPQPGPGELVIRLHAAALNHRDLHITNPRNTQSFIYGSDGAGEVEGIGEGVLGWQTGDPVIINPQISCLSCQYCLKGEHALCESGRVLGGTSWNGTFAHYVKIPARNAVKKPPHLTFAQAAALPLAFGTAWRALITQAALKPGETVLIQGIGGGVALFCLQIAVQIGARVIVTSGSTEKLAEAFRMGAFAGIHYRDEDVAQRVLALTSGKGADVVISSSGEAFSACIAAAGKQARLVHYAYMGNTLPAFDLDMLMSKQLSLYGSAMHTYPEFAEAMAFVESTRLVPVISHTFRLEEAKAAFQLLRDSGQFGKILLTIDS
ncbi:MAG: alcohol dehydrogenase catalytic domain-containing protein [Clostridia bacterium]